MLASLDCVDKVDPKMPYIVGALPEEVGNPESDEAAEVKTAPLRMGESFARRQRARYTMAVRATRREARSYEPRVMSCMALLKNE